MKGFDGNSQHCAHVDDIQAYLQDARRRRARPQQATKLERQAPACLVSRSSPVCVFFTAISDNESVGIDSGKLHRGQQPGAIASSAPRY